MKKLFLLLNFSILLALLGCNSDPFGIEKRKVDKENKNTTSLFLGALAWASTQGCPIFRSDGSSFVVPNIQLSSESQEIRFGSEQSATVTMSLKANQIVTITSLEGSLNPSLVAYFNSPQCPISSEQAHSPVIYNTLPLHSVERNANSIKFYSERDINLVLYIVLNWDQFSVSKSSNVLIRKSE